MMAAISRIWRMACNVWAGITDYDIIRRRAAAALIIGHLPGVPAMDVPVVM